MTGILVFIMVGLSAFLAPVLKVRLPSFLLCFLIVTAWCAETYPLLFFLSVTSVGHAFNEINEVQQQISRIDRLSEGDEIWQLVVQALLYINAEIGELWPRECRGGAKILITEGCKTL